MSEILQVANALLGIDVSHYQGVIDWVQVAEAGVKFAFIKATDGESVADQCLHVNVNGAKAVGIPYGLYHFWRPQYDPMKQANNFLRTATSVGAWEFAVALDIETGSLSEENQEDAFAWLAQVDQCIGSKPVKPIVYVSPSYAKYNLTDPAWIQYPLWAAHYTDLPQPNTDKWPTWMFWQKQGNATIPGISTAVDVNWFNGSEEDFQKLIQLPT